MDKYVIAPPSGSNNNSVGAADRPWKEGHFENLPNWQEYLAESTGYGIVSGCAPSISGLTVTVGAGIVHLADGTRKEIAQTNITLDDADSTNTRIDVIYLDKNTGMIAVEKGQPAYYAETPSINGIGICNVAIPANATSGDMVDRRDMINKLQNYGVTSVKDFGAVGDGETDDTIAIQTAINHASSSTHWLVIPAGKYKISSPLEIKAHIKIEGTPESVIICDSNSELEYMIGIDSYNLMNHGIDKYNRGLFFIELNNFVIDCNNVAKRGLVINSLFMSRIENIRIHNFMKYGICRIWTYNRPEATDYQSAYSGIFNCFLQASSNATSSDWPTGMLLIGNDDTIDSCTVVNCNCGYAIHGGFITLYRCTAWVDNQAKYLQNCEAYHVTRGGKVRFFDCISDTMRYGIVLDATSRNVYARDFVIMHNSSIYDLSTSDIKPVIFQKSGNGAGSARVVCDGLFIVDNIKCFVTNYHAAGMYDDITNITAPVGYDLPTILIDYNYLNIYKTNATNNVSLTFLQFDNLVKIKVDVQDNVTIGANTFTYVGVLSDFANMNNVSIPAIFINSSGAVVNDLSLETDGQGRLTVVNHSNSAVTFRHIMTDYYINNLRTAPAI